MGARIGVTILQPIAGTATAPGAGLRLRRPTLLTWSNRPAMSGHNPPDRVAEILRAQRTAMIDVIARRIHQEIPDYHNVPLPTVTERFTAIVDAMIASLTAYDPTHLTQVLEHTGRQRIVQGYGIDALLTAADIVEQTMGPVLTRELADDPDLQAGTLRRLTSLVRTARHILSRINLDEVVKQGPKKG